MKRITIEYTAGMSDNLFNDTLFKAIGVYLPADQTIRLTKRDKRRLVRRYLMEHGTRILDLGLNRCSVKLKKGVLSFTPAESLK